MTRDIFRLSAMQGVLLVVWIGTLTAAADPTPSPGEREVLVPDWSSVTTPPFYLIDPEEITNPILTREHVTDMDAVFVADPFLFREGEEWLLFFEARAQVTGLGKIALARSADGLSWTYDQVVISEPWHLSYPQVFKVGDTHYMIPETAAQSLIVLYEATSFPIEWAVVDTLVHGTFADPSLLYHQDTWWLFASNGGNSNCHLFYADDLRGPWTGHPQNPIVAGNASKARPAGRFFVVDGDHIVRTAQKCDLFYGEQVRAFEVDLLSRTQYLEHEVPASPILRPTGSGWNGQQMHHLDPWWTGDRWLCAVDGAGYTWSIGIYVSAPGITYQVAPDGSGQFPTIQAAIDAADDLDVIALTDGVFSGDGNRDLDFGGKRLTVRSQLGDPEDCIIDCGGAPGAHHRGFIFQTEDMGGAHIQDITIRNGYATQGGAILCDNAAPSLTDCILVNNTATEVGGGICLRQADASAVFTRCLFARNAALLHGGAVYAVDSAGVTLLSCTLAENASPIGAGLSARVYANVTLQNTIVAFGVDGEALYCDGTVSAALACSDLYANAGGDWLGCIATQAGQDGNFSLDPHFCDPAQDDFYLWNDSPCWQVACGLVGARHIRCLDVQAIEDPTSATVRHCGLELAVTTPSALGQQTTLTFVLPGKLAGSPLQLAVYDTTGRLVRQLVNRVLPVGSHKFSWDGRCASGRPVAGGVYFCRLSAAGLQTTRPVIRLR